MRRDELLITAGLLVVLAIAGTFHFAARQSGVRPTVTGGTDGRHAEQGEQGPGAGAGAGTVQSEGTAEAVPGGLENINAAGSEDLMRVRGIGAALAGAIIEHRQRVGGFRSMDEVGEVAGIGEKRLAALREHFTVPALPAWSPLVAASSPGVEVAPAGRESVTLATPRSMEANGRLEGVATARPGSTGRVNINTAGPAELEALPGIGPVIAGRILEYRRRHGPFGRTDDLEKVSGIGPAKMRDLRPLITVGD